MSVGALAAAIVRAGADTGLAPVVGRIGTVSGVRPKGAAGGFEVEVTGIAPTPIVCRNAKAINARINAGTGQGALVLVLIVDNQPVIISTIED